MGWKSRNKFGNHRRSEKGNVHGMIKDDKGRVIKNAKKAENEAVRDNDYDWM